MIVIVPNHLSEELYRRIDAELVKHPDLIGEREEIFGRLLEHFNLNGVIPDFKIERILTPPSSILDLCKPTFDPFDPGEP